MAVALIVAAGRGERLGADRPKALVPLAGRSLLQWSVDVLSAIDAIERIVVALPAGVSLAAPASGSDGPDPGAGVPRGATAAGKDVIGIEGGAVRSESVKRALAAAGPGDPVLIHDAARPLVTSELVRATLDAVSTEGVDAAIAASPVTDTIKRTAAGTRSIASGEPTIVEGTLDRNGLWAAQTPQVFRRAVLERALEVDRDVLAAATDDAWLVERIGGRVAIVPSGWENLKVTSPLDLALAEVLLSGHQAHEEHRQQA